jgi:arylformamidase
MVGSVRDISGWVYTGMWSYSPEYPGAEITELPHPSALPEDYPVYLQRFAIGGQTGTYIETKAHVDRTATPVTELPLSAFCLPAVVIDVGPKQAGEAIVLDDLLAANPPLRPGDAVLLRTGWDQHWESPRFVADSPYVEREAARWLIDHDLALLGSDFPRFDRVPDMQFPWEELWARVGLVLAPVTNLGGFSGRCGTLLAFPLKIRGACATPCRAALLLDDDGDEQE